MGFPLRVKFLEHTSEKPTSRLISQVLATLLGSAKLPSHSQSLILILEALPHGPHSPKKAASLANDTWETVLRETIKLMQKHMIKSPKHLSQTSLSVSDKQKDPRSLAALPLNPFLMPFFLLCWATSSAFHEWTALCCCPKKMLTCST